MIRPLTLLFLLFVGLTLFNPTTAHELRPVVAEFKTDVDPLEINLRVNLEAIVAGIGPEHSDTNDSSQSNVYQQLRQSSPSELAAAFKPMHGTFLASIRIDSADGQVLTPQLKAIEIEPVGDTKKPRDSRITLLLPVHARSIHWQWDEQMGPIIIRDSNPQGFSQYLAAGQRSDTLVVNGTSTNPSMISNMISYTVVGIEHIIPKGLDHILFVVGIFLLSPAFKPIVLQVSMFTLAHTLTLALGITGVVGISSDIVEPLIALSITIICLENLFKVKLGKARLATVFAFGLLHGLGFAGVLGEVGLPANQLISSLIAFNIGVEIGQLLVILACFAVAGWWYGNRSWYRTVVSIPASLVIGATGLFWSLQRVGVVA